MKHGQLVVTTASIIRLDGAIFNREQQVRCHESCNASMSYRVIPELVMLPQSAEQVQQIVEVCYDEDISFVDCGSRMGLTRGALSVTSVIFTALSTMRRILEMDIPNQWMGLNRTSLAA